MKNYLITLPLILAIVCCKNGYIDSITPTEKPIIDGNLQEWQHVLTTPENESFGFSVMNDESNLYISILMQDEQDIMKLLGGFTLWINKDGKNKKTFGIKYPLDMAMQGGIGLDRMNERPGGPDEEIHNFDFMIEQNLAQQKNIIVIDNDTEHYVSADNGEDGIQVKINYDKMNFIYELKVPFNNINISEDGIIAIGIESAEMLIPDHKAERGGPPRGGMPGGGSAPPSGGMPGGGGAPPSGGMKGGGGMPGGNFGAAPDIKPIKYWFKVQLM